MSVCVCSLIYPARKSHLLSEVLYLQPGWPYHILPRYVRNETIFGKKLLNIKHMFGFFLQPKFEHIPHRAKNSTRYHRFT